MFSSQAVGRRRSVFGTASVPRTLQESLLLGAELQGNHDHQSPGSDDDGPTYREGKYRT